MSRLPIIYAVVWDDVIVCDTSGDTPVPVTRMGSEEADRMVRSIGADMVEPYFPVTALHLLREEIQLMRSAAAEDGGFAAAQRGVLASIDKLIERGRE